MLDQIDAALSLVDRYNRWKSKRTEPSVEPLPARFVRLFEAHGVHRNQIPRAFGHGVTLSDMRDNAALACKLDHEHLLHASELFGVELSWLESGEGPAQERQNFYKQPQDFAQFIEALVDRVKETGRFVRGLILWPTAWDSESEMVLLLAEPVGFLGHEVIERFHWVSGGPPAYWRSRSYVASQIALATHHNVILQGRKLPNKVLASAVVEPDLVGLPTFDRLRSSGKVFQPEDWVVNPKSFLEDLDPERNNFGLTSSLRLWMDLEDQGLMPPPPGSSSARSSFAQALRQLTD
jgi:hypothetical protein